MVGTKNVLPEQEVQVDSQGVQVNPSTIEKQTETIALMNTLHKPLLQQDLIDNPKYGYTDKARGFVFGRRSATVQNAVVDLWDGPTGTYVFPTVGQQMKFVSSSANDTLAGTGVQKIHIHYLDSNYVPHVETVDMNGTTAVNTVATDIFRINSMHAMQVGSLEVAAGNISLQKLDGSVTYAYMSAGFNLARQAIYTTPAGFNGYINHWQASSGSTGNHFCTIFLRAKTHLGISIPVFLVVDEVGSQNGGGYIPMPIPIFIPEKTDVKMSAVSDASNANVTAIGAVMGWFETM